MQLTPNEEASEWGCMRWLASGNEAGLSLASMRLKPKTVSPAHRHDNCNEVIHLLKGHIEERLGDDWVEMSPGETLLVKAGVVHQTRNVGEADAELMIAYSSGERNYEELTA